MALAVRVAHLDSCHEIAEAWALQSQQVAQPPTVQQVNFNFVNGQALTQLFTLVGTTFLLSLPLPKSRSKSRNRTGQQNEKSKALYRAEPGQCDSMWQDWFKILQNHSRFRACWCVLQVKLLMFQQSAGKAVLEIMPAHGWPRAQQNKPKTGWLFCTWYTSAAVAELGLCCQILWRKVHHQNH